MEYNSHNPPARLFVAGLTLGMVLLPSCTTHVIGLYRHPSFTYSDVVDGKMGIGGVTALATLHEAGTQQYAEVLRSKFLDHRPRFQMSPAGACMRGLDDATYHATLAEYRATGHLSQVRLDALSSKVEDCRYLVFARIETDQVSQLRSSEAVENESGKSMNRVVMSTEREASVLLSIYDLRFRILAWQGKVEKTVSRSSTRLGTEAKLWERAVDLLLDLDPHYPAPAGLGEVLRSVFAGFAENMPSKSEKLREVGPRMLRVERPHVSDRPQR